MDNKYFYLFIKDFSFRSACLFPVIVLAFCFILFRLSIGQDLKIKDNQIKRALIAQIPVLEVRVAQLEQPVIHYDSWTLNGIITNKGLPMAVINNTFLKVGDKIAGKMVTAITLKTTTLCDIGSSEKCFKLYLYQ
jgi:hypothetical protein